MSSKSIIVLLGAPGAGKGTQARRISQARTTPHISTGDLFREHLKLGTELGNRAKGYMESGQLVPDALVIDMLFDRVGRADCDQGYLLDGFPRTLPQAQAFDERLDQDSTVVAIDIQVPDDVIVRRAAGRLICKDCGNIQHKEFSPPSQEGICDVCGGELGTRKDDVPEVVRERLAVYHTETAPLVDYYRNKGVLVEVDGDRDPDLVFENLASELDQRFSSHKPAKRRGSA